MADETVSINALDRIASLAPLDVLPIIDESAAGNPKDRRVEVQQLQWYLGGAAFVAARAPGASDDAAAGYRAWVLGVDTSTTPATLYICVDDATGSASWVSLGPASGFAPADHEHSASAITSGTLSVQRGGTGAATFTTGNYLRGNGTGALDARTPAQVLSDIGAAAAEHTHVLGDIAGLVDALAGKSSTAHSHALNALSDVDTSGVADGNVLLFDLDTSTWKPGTVSGGAGGDMLKSTYDTNNDGVVDAAASVPWAGISGVPATFAPSAHDHTASEITSGTLPVNRGGTGVATFTSGNYLRGNGTAAVATRTPAQVLSDIGAAAADHSHAIGDVTGLQGALDGKAASGHSHSLDSLSNVTITSNSNGELLAWNTSSSAWINQTLAELGISAVGHKHAAGDIDSGTLADARIPSLNASKISAGTLAVARGGTGIASYTVGNYIYASGTTTLAQRTPTQVKSDLGFEDFYVNPLGDGDFHWPFRTAMTLDLTNAMKRGTGTVTYAKALSATPTTFTTVTGSTSFAAGDVIRITVADYADYLALAIPRTA